MHVASTKDTNKKRLEKGEGIQTIFKKLIPIRMIKVSGVTKNPSLHFLSSL